MINVAIENVAMKKNCVSTSGDKKISKGWNENLILILHGVGVVRICTNVKFRMFFFCLLFVFL
jgi:hypothetical protein